MLRFLQLMPCNARSRCQSPLLYLSVDKFAEFVWTIGDDEGTCSIFGCRINEVSDVEWKSSSARRADHSNRSRSTALSLT